MSNPDNDYAIGRTVMAELPVTISVSRKKNKDQTPQELIDEFWTKFTTKAPGKATTVIPSNEYAERASRRSNTAVGTTTQASYEEAAAVCAAKVAKIVKECRRVNQKYRDPHFDLELDLKWGQRDTLEMLCNTPDQKPKSAFYPKAVKRVTDIFEKPKFYIDGPTANDVRQGRDGDCWLLAGLCTLSNKPGLIQRVCVARDEDVGVYGFVFHRDGEWISVIIDDKLFLTKPDFDESYLERLLWEDRERVDSEEQYRKAYQSGSGALYFAQCEHADETWLPLLEKAYAKAHGDYQAIEGGFTGEGIEDLTGGVTTELYTGDILDKEYFWKEELLKVNDEFLFGCSTGMWGTGWGERKGIVELHAYSIMKAVEIEDKRLVLLKNPWGKGEWRGPWSDGSKEWTAEWLTKLEHKFGDDGNFWISYEDLLRKYQAFDRTRLFGPDWKITSIWTTVSVPWTLDYHDTHFAFSLAKKGSVVLVLSQLDTRYYRGLEGQYWFELNFRLHKKGQEDYVVRSIAPYRQTRSVNVELELEAGEYTILMKVNATRNLDILPIEDVIRDCARDRRDKLVAVGMSYDMAHSKGKVIETKEEKQAKKAMQKRVQAKEKEDARQEEMIYRRGLRYRQSKEQQRRRAKKAKQQEKRAARKAEKEREEEAPEVPEAREAPEASKAPEPPVSDDKPSDSADQDGEPKSNDPKAPPSESNPSNDKTIPEDKTASEDISPDATQIATPEATPEPSAAAKSEPDVGTDGATSPKPEKPEAQEKPPTEETKSDTPLPSTEAEAENEAPAPPVEEDIRQDSRPPSPMPPYGYGPRRRVPESEPPTSDDEDTLSSISSVTDREWDIIYRQRRQQSPAPTPAPQQPQRARVPPSVEESEDEFESNPWNAVATVGLRVYYKVAEADRLEEIVKLRVVRPNPWAEDGLKKGAGDKGDGGEKGEDGSTGEGNVEGEHKEKKDEMGLDVDDSAKDSTLEGEVEQRKKSILSLIPPHSS
ncbi:hypothetical protein F4808DRAFT_447388 [Astrocystis sublimbata]|nr:hypothetical protein F4808DRAFT_447388 [Astrocystis sublimbata]